jgi:DNA helicase HerA-like ATPase
MFTDKRILVGKGETETYILPSMANRHGLIAGATGTGKTITLKVMAESFSDAGVPVFLADIKGDLAGCVCAGEINENISSRLTKLGIDTDAFPPKAYPVRFWDVFGEGGHPVRTTVSEMGALLLSRLLGLTEVQTGVLSIVFRIADDNGWLLIDLKDLRAMVNYVADHAKEYQTTYGNVSRQSAGAIQRALLQLEDAGGGLFFGEPDIRLSDWMERDMDGRGMINILHCTRLSQSPLLYSTFMLWLLSELFEELPEAGDLEKPKLVFFFDEAHMLFNDAPKALKSKVEQVVKLIRSKGIGVYFITQQPGDIPDPVLAQLGNRVQHALRAYTPAELKAVRAAAQSFRSNPAFDTEQAILSLGTGEAIVSFLDEKGRPSIAEMVTILPPQSRMGAIDDSQRKAEICASDIYGKYETSEDRRSAYEILTDREEEQRKAKEEILREKEEAKAAAEQAKEIERAEKERQKEWERRTKYLTRAANSAMNTIGREVGKSISRGILGTIKKMF